MRPLFAERGDRAAIPHCRFFVLVVRALLAGALAAPTLGAAAYFTLVLVLSDGSLNTISGGIALSMMLFATVIGVALTLAIIPFGPLTYLVARLAYRMGIRSSSACAAIGATLASLGPLLLDVIGIFGRSMSLQTALVLLAWFAASGAVAGWTFARALSQEGARKTAAPEF